MTTRRGDWDGPTGTALRAAGQTIKKLGDEIIALKHENERLRKLLDQREKAIREMEPEELSRIITNG
jgi:cell shape-determining protein MreC